MNVKEKREKMKILKEDLSSTTTMLEKNLAINQKLIPNQILLIKTDLVSQDETTKKTALDMLECLLNQKSLQVQIEVTKLLNEDSANELLDIMIIKYVKNNILHNIIKAQDITDVLSPWQNVETVKLNMILEDVFSNELPKEKCKYFFISQVIPAMMLLSTENNMRNMYIEIAFLLSRIVPISELSPEELEKFLMEINSKFIGAISQLRDGGFLNWHKLWIFLVRFCDRNIHNSMDLTNRLLRVVEFAFRNSSVEQRLKGYDCWKELIDNAGLDRNHICSSKQIKLLITPLRAKFSKQEVVICKRFEIFVYLMEKLQQKAVLCLREFLEFCFGPVGDNKDCSRSGQGRAISQLWIKSTKVLLEIIGHSHGNSIDCLHTKDVINLEEPIVNHRNIQNYYKLIINSVSESCVLLKDVESEPKRMKVIKCMWVTIFDLVVPASRSNREKYFEVLSDVLDNFVYQSTSNLYFQDLVVLVFTVLMSFDKDLICECIKLILSQLLTILFTTHNIPANISENFKQALTHSFSKVIQEDDKLKMTNIIINCFANLKSHEEGISNVTKIWLFLASELISDFKVEKIEKFPKLNAFFLWPALNMHRMEENSKKLITISWLKIYKKICQDTETKKLEVMKDLEKIFKNNPLLSSNVISLLNIMSQFETKFSQDFVNKLMIVSSMILELPNLKSEDENKISTLVMQYFEPALECYKTENDEVIKNICISIEHILKIHGGFRILEPLTNFLKQSARDMRVKYSKHLENLVLDLYTKESDSKSYNAKELSKILAIFNEKEDDDEKKTFVIPTGRSARIANLAKNSPKSPDKQKRTVASPVTLRLFGKDPDTMSPLKVKGSQLNNTPSRMKKMANSSPRPMKRNTTPSINDESSSEFVQINTEIKLEPEKLSDHQREVLKKRREDIPALYQDLSQSLSQDMFHSKSKSKEETVAEPKVVVEFIEPIVLSIERDEKHWNPLIDARNEVVEKVDQPQKVSALAKNTPSSVPDLFSDASNDPITKSNDIISNSDRVLKEEATRKTVESNSTEMEKKISADLFSEESQPCCSDSKTGEGKISADLFSNESQPHSSDNKKTEIAGNKKRVEENAEEKKRKKMEAELLKLKMDIVGAAEFVATARRTRHKEKPKKLEENLKNKISSPKSEKKRKSLSLERNDAKGEQRRKSTGTALVGTDLSRAFLQSEIPESNSNQYQDHKTDEEIEDSLEQYIKIPQVGILSTSKASDDRKETTLSNKKSRKTKEVSQKTETKMADKATKLIDGKISNEETDSKKYTTQENIAQAEVKRNTRKSLKINQKDNNNAPSRRGIKKNKDDGYTDNVSDSPTSNSEIFKEIADIQDTNESIQNIDESIKCTPKRGQKRKYSTDDDDDEDIIQSSQESAAELTPLLNSSKKKMTKISFEKNNSNEESTIIQQKTITAADFITEEKDSAPVVVIQRIAEIDNNKLPVVMDAETGDLVKENDETVETQDIVKIMEDDRTEQVVEMYRESKDNEEIKELLNDVGEIKDENALVEKTDVNEMIADMSLGANTTQDTTLSVIQDSTQEDMASEISEIKHLETQDTQTQPPTTQETPTQDSNAISTSEDTRPRILYFDLPKKPQLTESEQIMCRMDTMSICLPNDSEVVEGILHPQVEPKMDFNSKEAESIEDILATPSTESPPLSTPPNSPKSSDLPASPITIDTPTRTSELLDNTLDISPITSNTNSPVSEVSAEIPKAIAIFFREEDEVEEKHERDVESNLGEGSTFSDEFEDCQNVIEATEQVLSEEVSIFGNVSNKKTNTFDKQKSANQLLFDHNRDPEGGFTPHTDSANPSVIQERSTKLSSVIGISPVPTKLFLKRRCGGVASSPSTGRIKRLMSHFGPKRPVDSAEAIDEDEILRFTRDIPSPMAVPKSSILKRKLSDVSDGDGLSPCAKRKRVNFSDPCLTSKKIFLKDDYQPSLEAKRLFDPVSPSKNQDSLKDIFNFPEDVAASESDSNSLSQCPETEPSLEIVNPMILRKDRPIYPKLVDCKDDVLVILKRVTSPIFITAMTNKLKTKNIKTIGDLAQQTELEINRIPFKVPVVANVYKALDNYYKMKNGITGIEVDAIPKINGNKEAEKKTGTVDVPVEKADVATEMRSLVEKATKENKTIDDLAKILLSSMDKRKIIDLVKNLDSPLTAEDFLEEHNCNRVLENVDPKTSTAALENIHQNLNDIPWEIVMKDRSVSDFRKGIAMMIEQKLFSRTQIIENCLLPLIENPSEIAAYLKSLSEKEFEDVVVDRLENKNVPEFLCRIMKNRPTLTPEMLMRTLCDNQVISRNNLSSSFQVCLEAQSDECRNELMVEMFRFLSEKLDVSTLGNFHVEFIRKLINKDE